MTSKLAFQPDSLQDDTHPVQEDDSSEHSSSRPEGTIKSDQAESDLRNKIISCEERQVRKARLAVAGTMLICTLAMSFAVYAYSTQSEYTSFKLEYELHVLDIIKLVQWEVQYNFALMQQLSASVTAAAVSSGAVFPNLTQPFFEITGGYVDGLGGIMSTVFAPLVLAEERAQWEEYSVGHQDWLTLGKQLRMVHPGHCEPMYGTIQDHEQDRRRQLQTDVPPISESIFRWENGNKVPEDSQAVLAPIWQVSPPDGASVNSNLFSEKLFNDLFAVMVATNQTLLSPATEIGDMFDYVFDDDEKDRKQNPHAFIMEPVYSEFSEDPKLVGVLVAITAFGNLFDRLLPEGTDDIVCVISDSCGNEISFELHGKVSTFLGKGDLHDTAFDGFRRSAAIEMYKATDERLCAHELHIYPTAAFRANYRTRKPAAYTGVVALAFFVTSLLLVVYDRTVTKRQEKTMYSALRSSAVVASLFPEDVRDQVMDSVDHKRQSMKVISTPESSGTRFQTRPIASYYPSVTLMFADLKGFTSWSSAREPYQVFELLETIFGAFDAIAKRRRIFKVETVGDCYVAVCGLPVARPGHAVAMARFARDCMSTMHSLVRDLEVKFGPDTSELSFRVGLHSGPITGGVLRGDNARFQLFGDTMNTASRMESTGVPGKIHISQATAELLIQACKSRWILPREDIVDVKGKGAMVTYWLTLADERSDMISSTEESSTNFEDMSCGDLNFETYHLDDTVRLDSKTSRLVAWNAQVLLRLLKLIVASRADQNARGENVKWSHCAEDIMDEVVESIPLPDQASKSMDIEEQSVFLSKETREQLFDYVEAIATLYQSNNFHNFEHASHVVMSVSKLLGRITAPSTNETAASSTVSLHVQMFRISSDPLTQFACVFSALIHDVAHAGVPNTQLVKESSPLADKFRNKSVAEQNSLDVAWTLLLEPEYDELRHTLCATEAELKLFRQVVIHSVLATDIIDRDLVAMRNQRWETAFLEGGSAQPSVEKPQHDCVATLVVEHLIQASDVAHTMQHWHIYRQWNERLFLEMSLAYQDGRSETDPAETWYQGEIDFFYFYIIPLAKKLKQCGVFGVASDEYLNYAVTNRDEWQEKGQAIVQDMMKLSRGSSEEP